MNEERECLACGRPIDNDSEFCSDDCSDEWYYDDPWYDEEEFDDIDWEEYDSELENP